MSESNEAKNISVFGGAAGGRSGGRPEFKVEKSSEFESEIVTSGAKEFYKRWKEAGEDWGKMPPESIDDLDAMWLAASIGRFLAYNNHNLVTGGYDMGIMGMINRSARIFGKRAPRHENREGAKQTQGITRIGVPLPNHFPDEEYLHVGSDIQGGSNLPDRLDKLIENSDAFIIMRGAHGTLNEMTTVIEEEDIRRGAGQFDLRPIIITDPSGYTEDFLSYIFGQKITKFKNSSETNVLDQVYILPEDSYVVDRETPLKATVRLSEKGEAYIADILQAYSADGNQAVLDTGVPTLREIINKSDIKIQQGDKK